jgi:hypothetical protein
MKTPISQHPRVLDELKIELASSPLLQAVAVASSTVAALQVSEEFRTFKATVLCISEITRSVRNELDRTLEPFRAIAEEITPVRIAVTEIGAHFASALESQGLAFDVLRPADRNRLRDLKSVTTKMTEVANVNFNIPENAQLHWSRKILTSRAALLEDCVLNAAALEKFRAAAIVSSATVSLDRLAMATQFVFDHADMVRRLPPSLPIWGDADRFGGGKYRDEEIGWKLELALGHLDERLLQLRRLAWRNLAGGGIAGARLAMMGVREVFTDVLHMLAPDTNVKTTAAWHDRPKHVDQPTRRMRLEYVLGEEGACEADALFQFSESVNRTQKFVHRFADDAELVRVQMAQLEIWIYLLLIHHKE